MTVTNNFCIRGNIPGNPIYAGYYVSQRNAQLDVTRVMNESKQIVWIDTAPLRAFNERTVNMPYNANSIVNNEAAGTGKIDTQLTPMGATLQEMSLIDGIAYHLLTARGGCIAIKKSWASRLLSAQCLTYGVTRAGTIFFDNNNAAALPLIENYTLRSAYMIEAGVSSGDSLMEDLHHIAYTYYSRYYDHALKQGWLKPRRRTS